MRRLYTLLWYLALPFIALSGLRRLRRERAAGIDTGARPARTYWRERLGLGDSPGEAGAGAAARPAATAGAWLWVHAASVGEVQLAAVLIDALRARSPHARVVLSCHTATGRARARELLPGLPVRYAPYDLPGAVRRCMARLHPRALVLVESELWPNLLAEALRERVPVLVASARLSARSLRAYERLHGLMHPAIDRTVWVGAQSAEDAQRFAALGVPGGRLSITGNLKFDRPVPLDAQRRGRALRALLGARPVWVAGSTHPAEQSIVLEAHRRVCTAHADALLLLAPRHPPRFGEAAAQLEAGGWRYRRRSRCDVGEPLPADCQVLLIDTLGELMDFYAAADIAFVGGSLIAVGGHNLLEPAALGLPLLAGPYQTNSPQAAQVLADAGALAIVSDAAQLATRVQALIESPELRRSQGTHAREVLQAHSGALQRLLTLIEALPGAP